MGFRLKAGETVGAGIRRIALEQLDEALAELRGAGDTARAKDKAVHAARKRMKRLRAVVRLVRDELGEGVFERENAGFRDAGGTLAEARDAAVLVDTLVELKGDLGGLVYGASRKKLMTRSRVVKKRVLEQAGGLEGVALAVEQAIERVGGWTIASDGWPALKEGLKRVYGDGRDAMSAARVGEMSAHGAELFHEWRKRVKDLWHQCEVLEDIWPAIMEPLAQSFHDLADVLGDEHDLAVLKQVMEADATARGESAETGAVRAVTDVVDQKRLILQGQAMESGKRLFAEKAGEFVKRLGKYWRAWKGEEVDEDELPATDAATPPSGREDQNSTEDTPLEGSHTGGGVSPAGPISTEQSGGLG